MSEYKLDPLPDMGMEEIRNALHEGPFDVQPMITNEDFKADNQFRAAWVAHALVEYAGIVGTLDQEPPETIIRDFLSDLRHLIDALPDPPEGEERPTFEDLAVDYHYEAEIRGEL